jgi:hypothetical protein
MRRFIGVLLLIPALAPAVEGWPEGLQLHGFLSQGFVYTSANRFFGPSERGSWELRELGINVSYQPRPELLFSGQLLSRTAGEMYDGRVHLDYALVDYSPVQREDLRLGLRAGRLKNPLGLYNDTRDVPFTRPSIFLPQSIYFDKVRNLELSADGAGLYADLLGDRGDLYLQFYHGTLLVDENVEYAYLFADRPGSLDSDDPWLAGRLMYELDGGRVRLAFSGATGSLNYHPGRMDALPEGRVDVDFWVLSAQYNAESWSLTAEYMREPVNYDTFSVPYFRNLHAQGYYLQATWRPSQDWELLLRYDVSYLDGNDRSGQEQSAAIGAPPHVFFAKGLTFGARWDITPTLMLRAEFHRVQGAAWLSGRENDLAATEEDWDMLALQLSWRF